MDWDREEYEDQQDWVSGAYGTADAATTSYAYDLDNNILVIADPLGHAATYTYDDQSRQSSVTDADGHLTKYLYDS